MRKSFLKSVLVSLLCSLTVVLGVAICTQPQQKVNVVAEETQETNVYDIFSKDFCEAGITDLEYWTPSGETQVLGDWGSQTQVGLKFRMYICVETFNLSLTLSSDGKTTTNRIPSAIGGLYLINFSKGRVFTTYPGASDFYVDKDASSEILKAGSTVAVEIMLGAYQENGTIPLCVKLNGEAVINDAVGPAYGDFLGKEGTKVLLSGGQDLIIESSEKTCVHERDAWTQPNDLGEIFCNCKHCDLLLEKSYHADIVDFSDVADLNSKVLEGDGILGDWGKSSYIGMASKIYLPNNGTFNFIFSILGDGKRMAMSGRYYSAFEFIIANGSIAVADSTGQILKSTSISDLTAGKVVALEFGVYTMNADIQIYFVKVNGNLIFRGEIWTETQPIGSYCAYSFSCPTLMETMEADCSHVAGESNASDESGYVEFPCVNCGKVLYKELEQMVYDISQFTGKDAYTVSEQFTFDINKEQCVGVKGMMYIPADAPSDFKIVLTLMTDLTSYAYSNNGYRDGLYAFIITKNTLGMTMPWAAHFFTFASINSSALSAGSMFAFEYVVYQITDSPDIRYAYFKLNGTTVIESKYYDQNFPLDTYFLMQTNTDIVLLEESVCPDGSAHKVTDWSEVTANNTREKVCSNCGKVIQSEEIPSIVHFAANYTGMVTLKDIEVYGETFSYNVPNVVGYEITDILVNGQSVFASAEELANGYKITLPRNSLEFNVLAVYTAKSYNASYQYQKDADIRMESSSVGFGGTATYYITVKNGKDVTSAKIGDVDYTDALEVTTGGYILTIDNVKENITLVLTMEKKQYAITIKNTIGGVLTANKAKVDAFGTVEVMAKLTDGYYLAYFLVNGEKTSSKNGVLTLTNISEDINISAVYVMLSETQTDSSSEEPFGCQSSIGGVGVTLVALGASFLVLRKKQKKENED